jgi:hypothetical protein
VEPRKEEEEEEEEVSHKSFFVTRNILTLAVPWGVLLLMLTQLCESKLTLMVPR